MVDTFNINDRSDEVRTIGGITAASSHTGNTTATIVGTITVPASSINPNSILEIVTTWSRPAAQTSGALSGINLNGTGGTVLMSTIIANTTRSIRFYSSLIMNNSLTAQKFVPSAINIDFNQVSAAAHTAATVDFTADVTFDWLVTLLTGTDTLTLESAYLKEIPNRDST